MFIRRLSFVLTILTLTSTANRARAAAPPSPPAPEMYDVQISYRINAFRNERLLQYYEMMRFLKKSGFVRDPDEIVQETEPEDVKHTRLRGSISAKRVRELLNERHIKSILLVPHGTKPPEDKTQMVRVELELLSGLTLDGQRQLSEQTFEVLAGIQFRGAVGYDPRGYTRLIGSMPYNRLDTLLTDLHIQPAGARLPGPFKNVWPVRVAEVFPAMPLPVPRPRPPQVPKGQEKLSPDLRDLLIGGAAGKPLRLEVILSATPSAEDRGYRGLLGRAAPGLIVEGRLGPLVTVVVNASQAPALAALPGVTGVRLPRVPQPARPSPAVDNTRWQPLLKASGAARLMAMGHRGRGTQLAIVDGDFRGWEALAGKGLPADTRLIDLTSERNADLQPDAFAAGGQGSGTRHALTIARLAPEVSLTLIRVDPAAPYMLEAVARAINGDPLRSIGLDRRLNELEREQFQLDKRGEALSEERRVVMNSFEELDESQKKLLADAEMRVLTPEQVEKLPGFEKYPLGVKARILYRVGQKEYDRDQRAYHQRLDRYLQFQRDMASLRRIRVVASGLSWNDGFPVDGTSTLSRYFDDRPFRAALWFQAAGDTRGQSWTGLFRDADGNGIMEFSSSGQALPAKLWTPELNFLSWRTPTGQSTDDIPAGTRLRITLQWREAHDPLYAQTGEDPYLNPLALLRVLLLRQTDPAGASQPADDLEAIAQSVGSPQRLDASPGSAAYEITLEVQIKKAGRYAVRIEGRAPDSIYPPKDPTLPAMRKQGELHVRLFVSPLDATGRAVLRDYVTANGSVGMPADSRTAITVGAADERDRRQPYSAGGAPFNVDLLSKPDVLAYDLSEGTAEAAVFAAGLTALAPEFGLSRKACLIGLRVQPGGVLRVPNRSPQR